MIPLRNAVLFLFFFAIQFAFHPVPPRAASDPAAASPASRPNRPVPDASAEDAATSPAIPPLVERAARILWPFDRPPQSAREAQSLLEAYRDRYLSDRTLFYLEATVQDDGGEWIVEGASNNRFVRDAAGQILQAAGCVPVRNAVRLLPSVALEPRPYGIVCVPAALTWAQPREGDGVQTEVLLGDLLFLLDESEDGKWLLAHAADGYVGWVPGDAVRRLSLQEFLAWQTASKAVFLRDFHADSDRVPAGAALPLEKLEGPPPHAVVQRPAGNDSDEKSTPVGESERTGRNAGWKSLLPGAMILIVPLDSVRLPPADTPGSQAVRTARNLLETPYVFGGRNRSGIDCSGLVSVAWAAAGVNLPRDARQQVLVGKLVAVPWNRTALQPGDTLFFCDVRGDVIHTGISLGGNRFIHAAPPKVQISSFDRDDPLYSETWDKHFAFGRRPAP